jgi:multidrug transporter EmrE-like cation transporter
MEGAGTQKFSPRAYKILLGVAVVFIAVAIWGLFTGPLDSALLLGALGIYMLVYGIRKLRSSAVPATPQESDQ